MRVYDLAKWNANTPTVDVSLSTTNVAGFEAYNDAATTLRLVRMTGKGWYWSDSQLLVSNKVDDEYSAPYLGADETGPAATAVNEKEGYKFPVTDRTHTIALGGSVKAEYTTGGATYTVSEPVKVVKTIQVSIHDMYDNPKAQGGTLAITKANLDKQVQFLQETHAQIGIHFDVSRYEDEPPVGVTLSNGLDYDRQVALPDEVKKLLADSQMPTRSNAGATGRQRIEVYFVSYRSNAKGAVELGAPMGEAYVRAGTWDIKYSDSVVLTTGEGDDLVKPLDSITFAHEVGHILENLVPGSQDKVHYPYIDPLPANPNPLDTVNLMVKGERMATTGKVTDSRRLTTDQQGRMQGWTPGS